MSRRAAATSAIAVLGAVLAVGAGYAWGTAHPRVHVEEVECLSVPGVIGCTLADGWDVAVPTDVVWHDADGLRNDDGRPACHQPG